VGACGFSASIEHLYWMLVLDDAMR
jgi:hypothetical protein